LEKSGLKIGCDKVKLGYDLMAWKSYGYRLPITVDIEKMPSLMFGGSSGSGKSYAITYAIKQLMDNYKCTIYFCDFKNSDDFSFMAEYEHYYVYMDCPKALDSFHALFVEAQQTQSKQGRLHILIFDEYAAFIYRLEAQDRKLANHYKAIVAEILMLGRSRNFGIWTICQRPDSVLFSNGSRDNYFIRILFGNSTMEARKMVVPDADAPKDRIYGQGEGICWIDTKGLVEIKIPRIKDLEGFKQDILQRLTTSAPRE